MTGGNFGVWGGMFSTFDCAVKGYRQKEDAWNGIISGFMTGGCLALRSDSFWFLRYMQIANDGDRWTEGDTGLSDSMRHSTGCL